jgi:GT2 family glycosyltransferase/glycosyltransferase involved in cell wall biosynthesis
MQETPTQRSAGKQGATVVDVVIPVFNGDHVPLRCIESVLAAASGTKTEFELLVIDDASTDAKLRYRLDTWANEGRLTLIRNEVNRGFVHSANRGLSLHSDRDVVLLNSDTEVAGDWLDRLTACAYRQADIGTVTPFSNNATICSFPLPCRDNSLPAGIGVEGLDSIFAEVNTGQWLPIPTAVGFCMYVRRDCLNAVGMLDEDAFGRGYGEENDLCRRALATGWRSVLCADVFVFHAGNASFGTERDDLIANADAVLRARHPDYFDEVHTFVRQDPPARLRRAVEIDLARRGRASTTPVDASSTTAPGAVVSYRAATGGTALSDPRGRPVQLHILHDLGGGIERWCRDFARADAARVNLVLKPFCRGHAAGEGLMLFASPFDEEPLRFWSFARPFAATTMHHPEYAQIVGDIVREYRVDAVLVSSLIGHSLDVLSLGPPTILIAHDYFPLCPAINLYYDGVCQSCDDTRVADCAEHNPDFNSFPLLSAAERIGIRGVLLDLIARRSVTVVVPCRVVWQHLESLFPSLSNASWVAIPHGTDQRLKPVLSSAAHGDSRKLRVVVLGVLSINKGVRLLAEMVKALTSFAEVFLVGAQEVGEVFLGYPGVNVIPRYSVDELQSILERIRPDVGLLLSIWPETFSYTLSELMQAAIPPVATNVGAFGERIRDGETGFLVTPNAVAIVQRLKTLASEPELLNRVRGNLTGLRDRSAAEMVADYHQLIGVVPDNHRQPIDCADASPTDALIVRQATALAAMWKRLKSLDLQLTMSRESQAQMDVGDRIAGARERMVDRQREVAEHQRAISEHQHTIAEAQRANAEQQRAIAEHHRALTEIQLNQERQRWLERANEAAARLLDRERLLAEKEDHVRALIEQRGLRDKQLAEMLASTSWRLTSPVRALGTHVKRLRLLGSCLSPLLSQPATIPAAAARLFGAWRSGGNLQLKLALLGMQADADHQDAWQDYRQRFAAEVRPAIEQAVAGMTERPLISIIVPTYNTPKEMLRQMIDSVRAQLYPDWELCIADDCSRDAGVRKLLKEYARDDARIRLHFGKENRGVSHASNRALELATGSVAVLLDHDDVLEEQALFRVAQAVVAEAPDLLYSDEIMVSPDMATVLQYAHRPAFSPEFLRGHPYIVHMVGFRTQLLREVGGFDENLRISQDYDLILRVAEKARTVVHIPESLYRWRIHGGSAGRQKMDEVMRTSRGILLRHLQRCGEAGTVNDGAGFNLFDTRYSLSPDLRVAIIIPTKNHGGLVRQCVDSIRATVRDVACDIVVIDHDSDDPATLEYLAAASSSVRVLRYSGPFNFSAINNWAVAQLDGAYSHYLFCNNDIEATDPGWLERMLELGQKPDVGIVGARLLYPDRMTIQHAGVCVGAFGAAEHYAKFVRLPDVHRYLGFSEILASNHEVSAVTAACLLMRRDAFEAAKGFDEALAVGFGDVDLCLRVGQLGYRILYCPHASLLHHESMTRGKTSGIDPHPEDSALFQARWGAFLHAGDPYFHPGLNQNSVAWQMRSPMRCNLEVRRRIYRRIDDGRQSFETSPGEISPNS